MSIAALPHSTAQAIGSTSILPDPCAVVKELVDNGLDAGATSISVEISHNSLDSIQVKDNGHGIAPVDFDYLCKKSYTSKIRTLEDLRNVGGQSLGFRGVALASAADMVDTLTVITRTKNEPVASVLKYDTMGQLVSKEKASHAIGTSICLTKFLKNFPVRRQTALKDASKTMTKLKKLLQAYALARPSIRLSLKVLNSKNQKDNWTYAPSSTADFTDASRKVVGVEVASQCISRSWPEDIDDESDSSISLLAYLPKADANFSKVGNCGQFISVDGRPLSSSRGVAKEIVRIFKSRVRSGAKASGISTLSDPFLCLHILCPKGAYDANIEPAKDDVLFAERDELIKLAEGLFNAAYGDIRSAPEITDEPTASVSGFNLLLRQPPTHNLISSPVTNQLPNATSQPIATGDLAGALLANQLSADPEGDILSEPEDSGTVSDDNSITPWSIAKTHFFHRSPKTSRVTQLMTPTRQTIVRSAVGRDAEASQRSPSDISSPSPQPSSPEDRVLFPRRPNSTSARSHRGHEAYTRASRERDKERYGNGSLDTWFVNHTGSTPSQTIRREHPDEQLETGSVMLDDLDNHDTMEQSSTLVNGSRGPQGSVDPAQQLLLSPRAELDNLHSTDNRQEFPVMEEWSSRLHRASLNCDQSQDEVLSSDETERALDFERRKREANIAHRQRISKHRQRYLSTPTSSQPPSKSPHHNRYLAARANLLQYSQQSHSGTQDGKTRTSLNKELSMKDNDPRVYLMRHQSELQSPRANDAKSKPKRIPTNRLPLEKIPNGFDLHSFGLNLSMPSSSALLVEQCKRLAEVDSYISGQSEDIGYHPFDPLDNSELPEVCKFWESTIRELIKENYRLKEVESHDAANGLDEVGVDRIDIYAAIQSTMSG